MSTLPTIIPPFVTSISSYAAVASGAKTAAAVNTASSLNA